MRQTSPRQNIRPLNQRALACVAALLLCGAHFTVVAQNDQHDAGRARFRERVRGVIETGIKFAPKGASTETIRESVESLSEFIERRSGVRLNDESRRRLASMEHRALSENGRFLSVDDVTEAIISSMRAIASGLSDAEIISLSGAYRDKGNPRDVIILRSSGEGRMKRKTLISQLRTIRNSERAEKLLLNVVGAAVRGQVQDRAQYLGEALPESFGSIAKTGMTPVQAFLIIYSVASDDLMNFTLPELKAEIEWRRQNSTETEMARAAKSETAYGAAGGFYATPLDVIFNAQVIETLLSRLASETPANE